MRWRIFFALSLVLAALVLWPLAIPLLVGVVLGFISEGSVSFIVDKLRRKGDYWRYASSAIVVVGTLLVIIIPVVLAVMAALRELLDVLKDSGLTLESMRATGVFELESRFAAWVSSTLGAHGFAMSIQDVVAKMHAWIISISSQLAKIAGGVLTGTPGFVFDLVVAAVTWFVFAAEGKRLRQVFLPALLPWQEERELLCGITGSVIRSLVVANVMVATLQAFIGTLLLWIFGVPNFFLWGFMAFFVCFVPIVGTGLIMIPSGLFLWLAQGRPVAGIFLALSAIGIGLVDNLLRPYLMRGGINLNLFWMLLAFLGGLSQFGPAGAIIGPLAFALVAALIKVQSENPQSENPVVHLR